MGQREAPTLVRARPWLSGRPPMTFRIRVAAVFFRLLVLPLLVLPLAGAAQTPAGTDLLFMSFNSPDRLCTRSGESYTCSEVASRARRTRGADAADLDLDGDSDLVVANDTGPDQVCYAEPAGFRCVDLPGESTSLDVTLADVDEDGDPDAIFSGRIHTARLCLNNEPEPGLSAPRSFACTPLPVGYASPGVTTTDMDGDGHLDLLFASGPPVQLCLGAGDGTFSCGPVSGVDVLSNDVAPVDLDGDGDLDLALATRGQGPDWYEDHDRVCFNEAGSFRCSALPGLITWSHRVAAADLDGDGDTDLAFAIGMDPYASPRPDRVCVNEGEEVFECFDLSLQGSISTDVVAADLDADGDLDLAFATLNRNRTSTVCANDGDAGFSCAPVSPSIGSAQSVLVGSFGNAVVGTEAPVDSRPSLRLSAPHPHPASGESRLTLVADRPLQVRADLFDAQGRHVAVLYEGHIGADAPLPIVVRPDRLGSGVYVVRVAGEGGVAIRSLVRL